MILLLLAACGRSPAPVDETVGNDDTGAPFEVGDQLSRSARPPLTFRPYFRDADEDGYGAVGSGLLANRQPEGYVRMRGDCDDADAAINPAATEVTDGVDNDCDRTVDEVDTGDTATDSGTDSGTDSDVDTATDDTASDSGADSGTSDSDDTAPVDTDTATVSGIVLAWDGTGGSFPATLNAWYGSATTTTGAITSATDTLVFSPSDAELSDHSWIDVKADWNSHADWSDDCDGFTVESADYGVALYEKTVGGGSSDACRVYVNLAVPTGGDVGAWTLVP